VFNTAVAADSDRACLYNRSME